MHRIRIQKNTGFALLLSVIISSVVLAIGISILNISISQITLSSTARESEFAFQAAHAGVDCLWYWRNENAAEFEALNGALPTINCFGESPATSEKVTVNSDSDGHATSFTYHFNWGDPQRCTATEMVVMNAHNRDVTLSFESEAVGADGLKTCNNGNTCTVLFSRGYNRPCDELDSSIFSLQRELTVEF